MISELLRLHFPQDGLLALLAGFGQASRPSITDFQGNKKSLIFHVKNKVFGAWRRGSCEPTLRNRALVSAPCIFLYSSKSDNFPAKCSIFILPCTKWGFGSMPPRLLPGYLLEILLLGLGVFRNRFLASAPCIFHHISA